MTFDLVGMFMLGLLGGGHCAGMCGPIALAICPRAKRWVVTALLYNLGRVLTYTAIGGMIGAMGAAMGDLAPVARVQVWLTVVAGVLLAWLGLALLRVLGEPSLLFSANASRLPWVGSLLRRAAEPGGDWFAFPLGLVLGFLPCGLSMAAFVRAVSAHGAAQGALLVAAFGVGTVPAMVLVGWFGARFSARKRKLAELVAGAILLAMAVQHLSAALPALWA